MPNSRQPTKGRIALFLAAIIVLDSFVQILWKQVAVASSTDGSVLVLTKSLLLQPGTWVLVPMFLLQLVLWTRLLKDVDLSFAQPIISLSYIGVGALSVVALGESFTMRKGISIALILSGVWLISRTPLRTSGQS